eukprot:460617_1
MNNNNNELLSYGYIREQETTLHSTVPIGIKQCIASFNIKYIIIACGENINNQLGLDWSADVASDQDSENIYLHEFTRLTNLENIAPHYRNVYINYQSMLVINARHAIYAAGRNDKTQLAIPASYGFMENFGVLAHFTRTGWVTNSVTIDVQMDTPILISTGRTASQSFIYTKNNHLYGNGNNSYGQIGYGHIISLVSCGREDGRHVLMQQIPQFWGNFQTIIDIQCGWTHSVFLTSSGNVYACGYNGGHQVSLHNSNKAITEPELIFQNIKQIAIGQHHNVLLKNDGHLIIFGGSGPGQKKNAESAEKYFINNKIEIKSIHSGADHVVILTTQHKLITFGRNYWGQCGLGYISEPNEIIIDPRIVSLGANEWNKFRQGQKVKLINLKSKSHWNGLVGEICGEYVHSKQRWPVEVIEIMENVTESTKRALLKTANIRSDGHNFILTDVELENEYVEQVSCGAHHSVVLTNKNRVYSFGYNMHGECTVIYEDDIMCYAHLVDKSSEMNIDDNAYIEYVIAANDSSIVFINPSKQFKL